MNKDLIFSSFFYRVYQIIIDAFVIFFLINLFGLVNSIIISFIINGVKVLTYYLYHNKVEKIILKKE